VDVRYEERGCNGVNWELDYVLLDGIGTLCVLAFFCVFLYNTLAIRCSALSVKSTYLSFYGIS
jgi:hypothetical protein